MSKLGSTSGKKCAIPYIRKDKVLNRQCKFPLERTKRDTSIFTGKKTVIKFNLPKNERKKKNSRSFICIDLTLKNYLHR